MQTLENLIRTQTHKTRPKDLNTEINPILVHKTRSSRKVGPQVLPFRLVYYIFYPYIAWARRRQTSINQANALLREATVSTAQVSHLKTCATVFSHAQPTTRGKREWIHQYNTFPAATTMSACASFQLSPFETFGRGHTGRRPAHRAKAEPIVSFRKDSLQDANATCLQYVHRPTERCFDCSSNLLWDNTVQLLQQYVRTHTYQVPGIPYYKLLVPGTICTTGRCCRLQRQEVQHTVNKPFDNTQHANKLRQQKKKTKTLPSAFATYKEYWLSRHCHPAACCSP